MPWETYDTLLVRRPHISSDHSRKQFGLTKLCTPQMQTDSLDEAQDAGQYDTTAHQTPGSAAGISTEKADAVEKVSMGGEIQSYQFQNQPHLAPTQQNPNYLYSSTHPLPREHQGAFDMRMLNTHLSALSYRQQKQPNRYVDHTAAAYGSGVPPQMAHLMNHASSFHGELMSMPSQSYYAQQPHMPQYFHSTQIHQALRQPALHGHQSMVYYSNPVMDQAQTGFFFPQDGFYASHPPAIPANVVHGTYLAGSRQVEATNYHHGIEQHMRGSHSRDPVPIQTNVRGPPRKPRQSGHALWIGNLPPQADLMALVEHICNQTLGLESLFLISKSNCAFANFKDEVTCLGAQQKLHDSKFQSVRLVSRLRKSTVEGSAGAAAPRGPATAVIASTSSQIEIADGSGGKGPDAKSPYAHRTAKTSPQIRRGSQSRSNADQFFILKSLTSEDLDLSVRTGIWATQSHNEQSLNNAFHNADNVYLIFSANKSGEYFGFARMISEINEDPTAAIEFAPQAMAVAEVDLPKAILAEATGSVPRGKIIDDSGRGTIFWEIEREDVDDPVALEIETNCEKSPSGEDETRVWGKPFKLEWLSTTRLPFFRTQGLRNPWNSNREVKIARDGTELEPSVGRKLIGLFNRVQTLAAPEGQSTMIFAPVPSPTHPYTS